MITCPFCLFDYDVSSSLGFAAYLDHPCFSEMVGGDGFILEESAQSSIDNRQLVPGMFAESKMRLDI